MTPVQLAAAVAWLRQRLATAPKPVRVATPPKQERLLP